MSSTPPKTTVLPGWLYEAIEGGSTDRIADERKHSRYVLVVPAIAQPAEGGPDAKPFTVTIFNASLEGIGFISRQELKDGQDLSVTPDILSDSQPAIKPLTVRVVYCKRTVQGYKVGCRIL